MSTLTEAIRKHHASMASTLGTHAGAVGGAEAQAERDSLVAFLRNELMPHARGEEHYLYPVVDRLVREHGKPTATMTVDHEFIADYVARIEQTTRQLAIAENGDRPRLLRHLHELAIRLDAIFELHLAKEERVYVPLLDRFMDDSDARQMLEDIHRFYERDRKAAGERTLDARNPAAEDEKRERGQI